MNISRFIARRILFNEGNSFSTTVARLGIGGIAIGLAVAIISFAILGGFKRVIRQKIFSFGAHLQVSRIDANDSYEEVPISTNTELYRDSTRIPYIRHIQVYAHKAGLLKTDEDIAGVVLKGVGKDFDLAAFRQNMQEGKFVSFTDTDYSKEIVISRKIASLLRLKVNDSVLLYFIQQANRQPRVRKLTVSGIYETGLEEFDETMVMGDIRLIQRLNDWPDTLVGGYEVYIDDFRNVDRADEVIEDYTPYDVHAFKITELYPQIFDWLALLNNNVAVFLPLILFVASFNMVAILLILIMERTRMIGLLQSLGATHRQIRRIFLLGGVRLIGWGMLWGNLIGLGFCVVQDQYRLVPLDPAAYYMDAVPIEWDFPLFLLANIGVLLLVTAVLTIPTFIITRIRPVQALRFD